MTSMTAEDRVKVREWALMVQILVKSANGQPRNEARVRLHQNQIEILLEAIQIYAPIPAVYF